MLGQDNTPPPPAGSWSAFLQSLQELVKATNAQAQNIKNLFIGATSSGDISGIYPGPITVSKTNGIAFTGFATAAPGQAPATATNDSAAAGKVGEYIESIVPSASAVPLVTATPGNVTSIPLTAGEWDVLGNVVASAAGGTTISLMTVAISTISVTFPNSALVTQIVGSSAGVSVGTTAPRLRLTLNGNATVFLVTSVAFAGGACTACGQLQARRAR